jgi:hypothetical protein
MPELLSRKQIAEKTGIPYNRLKYFYFKKLLQKDDDINTIMTISQLKRIGIKNDFIVKIREKIKKNTEKESLDKFIEIIKEINNNDQSQFYRWAENLANEIGLRPMTPEEIAEDMKKCKK